MEQSDIVEKLMDGLPVFENTRVPDFNAMFRLQREAAAEITRLRAALAEKMVVKVKPLEWSPCEEWKQCSKERAPAFGGEYQIVLLDPKDDKRTSLYFEIGLGAFMFRFEQGEPDELGPTGPKKYPTVDAAKAAAQADYERRILTAVEAVPASQIRAEALREGYRNGVEAFLPDVQLMEGCRLSNGQFNVQSRPVDYDPCSTGTDGQFNAQCVCRRRITEALALIDAPKVTT